MAMINAYKKCLCCGRKYQATAQREKCLCGGYLYLVGAVYQPTTLKGEKRNAT